ncbi:hypothetical protein CNMCM6936_007742 [Aspergillus lentulus]|nr:hypothetical protein CNMCM6069_007008 [Aspergillus lentulus]KAF4154868.1 hypothetical protein CNMCM6936_007742 [Aspergillus lentulus]KAF4173024.1 hypothetical protein CNMCM7927_007719 [Aspergillus lentulus]
MRCIRTGWQRQARALKHFLGLRAVDIQEVRRRGQDARAPEEALACAEVVRVWVWGVGHVGAEDGTGGGGVADDEHVARPRAAVRELAAMFVKG